MLLTHDQPATWQCGKHGAPFSPHSWTLTIGMSVCRLSFHFDTNITRLDLLQQTIVSSDGKGRNQAQQYDLIIGADGRHSMVRQAMQDHNPLLKVKVVKSSRQYISFCSLQPEGTSSQCSAVSPSMALSLPCLRRQSCKLLPSATRLSSQEQQAHMGREYGCSI